MFRKKLKEGGYYYFLHYPSHVLGRAFSSPFDWFFKREIIKSTVAGLRILSPAGLRILSPPPIVKWHFSWKTVLLLLVFPVPLLKVVYNLITFPIKYFESKSIGIEKGEELNANPRVQIQEIAHNSAYVKAAEERVAAKPEQQTEASNFLGVLKSEAAQAHILQHWNDVDKAGWSPNTFSRILDDSPFSLETKGIIELFLPSLRDKQDNLGDYWKKLLYLKVGVDIFARDGSVKSEILKALGDRFEKNYYENTQNFKKQLFAAYLLNISSIVSKKQTVIDAVYIQSLEQEELENVIIDSFISKEATEGGIGKEAFSNLTKEELSASRKDYGTRGNVCRALSSAVPDQPPIEAMRRSLNEEVKIYDVGWFIAEQQTSSIQFLQKEQGKIHAFLDSKSFANVSAMIQKTDTLIGLVGEHINILKEIPNTEQYRDIATLETLQGQLVTNKELLSKKYKEYKEAFLKLSEIESEANADASLPLSSGARYSAYGKKYGSDKVIDAIKGAVLFDLEGKGRADNTLTLLRNAHVMKSLVEGPPEVVSSNIVKLVGIVVDFYNSAQKQQNPEFKKNAKNALKRLISTSWRPFGINFGKRMSEAQRDNVRSLISGLSAPVVVSDAPHPRETVDIMEAIREDEQRGIEVLGGEPPPLAQETPVALPVGQAPGKVQMSSAKLKELSSIREQTPADQLTPSPEGLKV